MSFAKASDLLRLVEMARGRHLGVSLDDIRAEFGCTHRTAQRMTRALEHLHPDVSPQLLIGALRYLVARDTAKENALLQNYRLDRIKAAGCLDDSFAPEEGFDIDGCAFGAYHHEPEFGCVVWRFAPRAAECARGFLFHPGQSMIDEPDGSVTVSFQASGWLEMCWHLYQWGDAVEVLEPAGLKEMVDGWSDVPALP